MTLRYDHEYNGKRAFMSDPLKNAIDELHKSVKKTEEHKAAGDQTDTAGIIAALNAEFATKEQEFIKSCTDKQTAHEEARKAALAQASEDRKVVVEELRANQTEANKKTLALEHADIENKYTEELNQLNESLTKQIAENKRITDKLDSDRIQAEDAHETDKAKIEERETALNKECEEAAAKQTAHEEARKAALAQESEARKAVVEATLALEQSVIYNKYSEEEKRLQESLTKQTEENKRITQQIQSDIARAEAAHEIQQAKFEERKIALGAECEEAAAAKTGELEKQKLADKARHEAELKGFQDSLERKIAAARQDKETRVYINQQLATAHGNRNQVGGHVQKQVAGLAGAAKKVAETLHYLHQNRVDGLNKGVTKRIDGVDDTINALDSKVDRTNRVTNDAVDANREAVEGHTKRINRVRTRAKVLTDRVKGNCNTKIMKARVAKIEEEASTDADKDAIKEKYEELKTITADSSSRRRLASNYASMTPSEQVLERRRLTNRPKSHTVVLEALLEEINRLN